jgi:septum site-determining protein MinC
MENPCFELKGSLFTLTVLQLFEDDLSLLETQLIERIKMAPGFFNHTPVVLDLHELPEEKQDFDFFSLRELLLSLSIIPVGVKGAAKSVHTLLEAAGMAVLAEAKTHKGKSDETTKKDIIAEPTTEKKTEKKEDTTPSSMESRIKSKPNNKQEPEKTEATEIKLNQPAKVIKQTIRSGRQIYAPGGDLIIIGSVSTGAEILADGNIHVYGTLRGRALAGVHGDKSASIYCHSLQAELVSISGIYLLSEDISEDKIGTIVQISLENEKLQMETIA